MILSLVGGDWIGDGESSHPTANKYDIIMRHLI